jgi:uncharacterized protein (TIGR03067 family)
MRAMTWAMSVLILGIGPMSALAQPAEAAAQGLQGTWSATSAEREGGRADDVVGHRLAFMGNRFEIRSWDGKLLFEGTFRTNTSASPAAIDFQHTGGAVKGTAWKGIYVLDGETLRICDNAPDPDKPRPAALEVKAGSGHVLITFRRARP